MSDTWTAKVIETTSVAGSQRRIVVLESGDFEHDAVLVLRGDFADEQQKLEYAQALAVRLGTAAEPVQPVALAPDEDDAVVLWAEIWRLRAALQGPDGYATWQDAALAERLRRIEAERKHTAPPAREPVRLTDADLDAIIDEQWGRGTVNAAHRAFARAVEAATLRANGLSTHPADVSKDGAGIDT